MILGILLKVYSQSVGDCQLFQVHQTQFDSLFQSELSKIKSDTILAIRYCNTKSGCTKPFGLICWTGNGTFLFKQFERNRNNQITVTNNLQMNEKEAILQFFSEDLLRVKKAIKKSDEIDDDVETRVICKLHGNCWKFNYTGTFSRDKRVVWLENLIKIKSRYIQSTGSKGVDAVRVKNANIYLNKKLGEDFVKEDLELAGVYHSRCIAVAFITKSKIEKNMLLVYFKPEEGDSSKEVDTLRSMVSKAEILNGSGETKSTCLIFGRNTAIKVAMNAELKEGLKPWETFLEIPENAPPKWHFKSTYTDSANGNSSGEWLSITGYDGTIERDTWHYVNHKLPPHDRIETALFDEATGEWKRDKQPGKEKADLPHGLKYVPDANLRKEFAKMGYIKNDSLDTEKTQGFGNFDFNNKGIENLDGLQYFSKLWLLRINNNKIKELDHLPPNLTNLDCSKNDITKIVKLPGHLEVFDCAYNKIKTMDNLPYSLTTLVCNDNQLMDLPKFSKNLQFLNYSHNPISPAHLPLSYKRILCDDPMQNCLPYELMNWKILNAEIKDTSLKIIGMNVQLNGKGGDYSEVETVDFKEKDSKLIADKVQIREYSGRKKTDTTYFKNVQYEVEVSKIQNLIDNIYTNNMFIQIQVGDSLRSFNLYNKKNGRETCSVMCDDCSTWNLDYTIYFEPGNPFESGKPFESAKPVHLGLENIWLRPSICSKNGIEDLKPILDWLYICKLSLLTMNDNVVTKDFFNQRKLDNVYKWANQ